MIYQNKKQKRPPLPFKLPFRINSVFFKSLLLTVLIVTFVVTMSFLSKRKHETLPAQATFPGFNIANKNREEIKELVEKELNPVLKNLEIILKFDDRELKINGSEYSVKINDEEFFNQAKDTNFAKGEFLKPKIKYDEKNLKKTLEEFKNSSKIEPSKFSYRRKGQILQVSAGYDGRVLNIDKSLQKIVDAFSSFKNETVDACFDVIESANKKINLKELKQNIDCTAQNAGYIQNSAGKTILQPEKDGLTLILSDEDFRKIDGADSGSYNLSLKVVKPSVTVASLQRAALTDPQLRDVLATFSTKIARNKNENGVHNIRTAAEAINNKVVMPGQKFSFQDNIIPTNSRYKEAVCFNPNAKNGEELGIGGGICQVCSTLFGAVLRCDLQIVTRCCHSKMVGYVPIGQDAAYTQGGKNLVFVNNRSHPIIIKAGVNDRTVNVTIYGKKLTDEHHFVVIDSKETTPPGSKKRTACATQKVYSSEAAFRQGQKPIKTWTFYSNYAVFDKKSRGTAAPSVSTSALPEETTPVPSTNATNSKPAEQQAIATKNSNYSNSTDNINNTNLKNSSSPRSSSVPILNANASASNSTTIQDNNTSSAGNSNTSNAPKSTSTPNAATTNTHTPTTPTTTSSNTNTSNNAASSISNSSKQVPATSGNSNQNNSTTNPNLNNAT